MRLPRVDRHDRVALTLLLGPYVLGVVGLVAVPAVATFVLAFTDWDLVRSPQIIGLDNFRELIDDSIFRTSLRNSAHYAAWTVPLRLGAALGLALLLHRRARGMNAYRASVYLPSVVPEIASALAWLWLFNPLYGPVNLALRALGFGGHAWLTQPGPAQATIIIMGIFTIGEGFLVLLATRQTIGSDLYEMAAVEGAGPFTSFTRVTLPLLAPTLLLLLFRDTVYSFQASFVPSLIVTEGGPPPYATTYLPLFIYRNGFEYLRFGYAAAATIVMFVVTALIVLVQWRIVRRWRHALAA